MVFLLQEPNRCTLLRDVILPGNSMCNYFDTVGSLSHSAESLLNEVFIHVWV